MKIKKKLQIRVFGYEILVKSADGGQYQNGKAEDKTEEEDQNDDLVGHCLPCSFSLVVKAPGKH